MKRRILLAALIANLAVGSPAAADGFADSIVRQLRSQGYSQVSVSDTWLGRTRIVATSTDAAREIILNPRTGEILRDLYTGSDSGTRIYDDNDNSGRGRGGDDGDDNDGDDNSGHGGGGGGGGNSGGGGDDD